MPDTAASQTHDAEWMAEQARTAMISCLKGGQSFRLEAGAGAGKTHALIEALRWLVAHRGKELRRTRSQIACITYTNVAVDEIVQRLGPTSAVWVSTIHKFLWQLISPFQKSLREELAKDERVREKLEADESEDIGTRRITYDKVGRLRLLDRELCVSHDHVISLAASLLARPKFRRVWLSRFPVLLLDEYQDTNSELMMNLREHLLGESPTPMIGLFGDHWQMIYDKVCGLVDDERITYIPKGANFRSCRAVVDALNRMRPELPQCVSHEMASSREQSDVIVLHTNAWDGPRGARHFKNALPEDEQGSAVADALDNLRARGWSIRENSTIVLRLTNRAVARTEGFADLLAVFVYPDDLLRRQDPFIDVFAAHVEPAADLAESGRRTSALEALGWGRVRVRCLGDKARAREWLERLMDLRASSSVQAVVEHLDDADLLSAACERSLRRATAPPGEAEDERTVRLRERWHALKDVSYEQVRRWFAYENGNSMLSTKHGVKGAQFDEVVVVFGGGWSKYDFPRMLAEWDASRPTPKDVQRFERARNLFYVTVSRARFRLALVFLKTLPPEAVQTVERLFGADSIFDLPTSQRRRGPA